MEKALILLLIWIAFGVVNAIKRKSDAQKEQQEKPEIELPPPPARPPVRSANRPVQQPRQVPKPKRPTTSLPQAPTTRRVWQDPQARPIREVPERSLPTAPPFSPPETVPTAPPRPTRMTSTPRPRRRKQPSKKPASTLSRLTRAATRAVVVETSPKRKLEFSSNPIVNGMIFSELFGPPIAKRPFHRRRMF